MASSAFDRLASYPIFDLRAAWILVEEFVGAAAGAFMFAAVLWAIVGLPGLLG